MFSSRTLYLLFFLSGVSSLIFEVVWTRLLLRTMGANVFSTACVLAAFMAGLAAGGYLASLRIMQARPLRAWGLSELVCGAMGAVLPFILTGERIEQLAGLVPIDGLDGVSGIARFLLAFIVLLVPTTAMGTGYPLLLQHLRLQTERDQSKILYAFNVSGAMLGSLAGGFLLLPFLGVQTTSIIAACINIAIFLVAFQQGRHIPSELATSGNAGEGAVNDAPSPGLGTQPRQAVEALVVLSGVGTMLLELAWTRIFSTAFGSTVYSSGSVFFLVLAGLACSAIMASRMKRGLPLSLIMLMCGLVIAATSRLFVLLPSLLVDVTRAFVQGGLSEDVTFILARLLLAVPLVLPVSILAGLIFPLAVAGTSPAIARRFYVASCLGSALGAIAGGGILLPLLFARTEQGISACVILSACIFTAAGLLFGVATGERKKALTASALITALTIACLVLAPVDNKAAFTSGLCYLDLDTMLDLRTRASASPNLEYYKEGLNATISVSTAGNTISLRSDGKVEATLPLDPSLIAPGCDVSTHALLGALAITLSSKPEHALLIGYGSGVTADAMLSFGLLQSLTVAELEPAVLEAAAKLKPFREPFFEFGPVIRPTFRVNDGRYVLAASKRKWDVIACQTAEPRTVGAADLYTREFWQLVRSRLTPGGVCSQWVQLYAMPENELKMLVRTFQSVFPKTYICHVPGAGEIILIGMTGSEKIRLKQINDRIQLANKNAAALPFAGITSGADLLATVKVALDDYADRKPDIGRLNVDDSSSLEYSCGLSLSAKEHLIVNNYDVMVRPALTRANSVPFDFLEEAGDLRLRSDVAVSLIRQANSGAFGSLGDIPLARRFAQESLALRSSQTLWNDALVRSKGNSANAKTLDAIQAAPHPTAADYLAIAQCELVGAPRERTAAAGTDSAGFNVSAVDRALSSAAASPDYQSSLGVAELLSGWNFSIKEQSNIASEHFAAALSARPRWAPALLGQLMSMELEDDRFPRTLRSALIVDPWNAATHLIATRYFLGMDAFDVASLHAVNCALLSGSADGFMLILARNPSMIESLLPVIERVAPADVRLQELKRFAKDGNDAVRRFASQAEIRISGTVVSGYNKLGFPW
ncbi:MAG: fused MFS/spermidine synthase [Candidatus Obscuribacterales bacterium]|nr:fused MFS/spermidine synthase [Candidatus Obscuribacterales bacterium]